MVIALHHSVSMSYHAVVTARRVHQLLVEPCAGSAKVVASDHVVFLFVHRRLLRVVVARYVLLVLVVHW